MNTTLGVAGIFDVASSVGLRKNEEDFGQTLAAWGVGSGPYVMLPVFGASNARDSVGLVLDTLLNPIQFNSIHRRPIYAVRRVCAQRNRLPFGYFGFG